MTERLEGVVLSAGRDFGFLRDASGRDFYFGTEPTASSSRLRKGERVTFVPRLSSDGRRFYANKVRRIEPKARTR